MDARHVNTGIVTSVRLNDDKGAYIVDMKSDEGLTSGFFLMTHYGVEPKVGDQAALHTVKGSQIVGLDLNGKTVFNLTDEDVYLDGIKKNLEYKLKTLKDFEASRSALNKAYDALPDVFKRRIDKFRANNPDFRWEYEGYEMSCCTDAVIMANTLKTPEAVKDFADLDWPAQKEKVPGLFEGHSGNSFGCAVRLAYMYLKDPEGVVKMYGALAPLVGSEAYGCVPRGTKEQRSEGDTP